MVNIAYTYTKTQGPPGEMKWNKVKVKWLQKIKELSYTSEVIKYLVALST